MAISKNPKRNLSIRNFPAGIPFAAAAATMTHTDDHAVHIHFKVRTNPGSTSGLEFTSQMFFDEALTDMVYAQAPYNTRGARDTTNARDGIYQGGGTQLIVPLAASGGGYSGTFNVGVRV